MGCKGACLVSSLPAKCASSLGCSTTQDDITSRVSRATDILPSLVTSTRRGSIPKLTNIFSPQTSLLMYETITFCETGHTLTTLPRSFSHPPMLIWRCENHEDAGPSDLPMIKTVALIHLLLIEKTVEPSQIVDSKLNPKHTALFLQQVSSQEGHQTWFESCRVRETFPMEPAVTNQLSCFTSSVRFRISGSLPFGTWPMNLPKRAEMDTKVEGKWQVRQHHSCLHSL